MIWASAATGTAIALALSGAPDREGFPTAEAWNRAPALTFSADWQGKNADPGRETEVRVLWTRDMLFLRFRCHYRNLTTFADSEPNGRRHQLWDRDVAEVFLQPDPGQPNRYWEFEVSPNGMWIDLDIELGGTAAGSKAPGHKDDPRTGMKSRVHVDEAQKIWTAEVALPMRNLTPSFDPASDWRVNFFRVEGPAEPRFYSSWQPTNTERPSFHVPEAFGKLSFR
ncbi:MAG TPA: carbohydrate-binding family 9-like protein [Candidatus Acidoferrum sp.]|nr:carbohydrate-binding family 9-like protein [Candidatus Acidoferrum sp.]